MTKLTSPNNLYLICITVGKKSHSAESRRFAILNTAQTQSLFPEEQERLRAETPGKMFVSPTVTGVGGRS